MAQGQDDRQTSPQPVREPTISTNSFPHAKQQSRILARSLTNCGKFPAQTLVRENLLDAIPDDHLANVENNLFQDIMVDFIYNF